MTVPVSRNAGFSPASASLLVPGRMQPSLVTPLIAGIGMSSSSLLVVLNALRLRARHGR